MLGTYGLTLVKDNFGLYKTDMWRFLFSQELQFHLGIMSQSRLLIKLGLNMFTLAKVEAITLATMSRNSDTTYLYIGLRATHLYLPWQTLAAWQKIGTILSVPHRPRWPRQVQVTLFPTVSLKNIANVYKPLMLTWGSDR